MAASPARNLSISRSRLRRERPPKADTFGALLRAERETAGLSQAALANRAGIDTTHMSRIESNRRNPGPETARSLADGLGLRRGPRIRFLAMAGTSPFDEVPDRELANRIAGVIENYQLVKLKRAEWREAGE